MSSATIATPSLPSASVYWPTPFSNQRYACLRELGETKGTPHRYSRVFLARDQARNGELVVIKQARTAGLSLEERSLGQALFDREATLLLHIQHSAVPGLLDRFREANRSHLVLEYCPGETLEEIFRRTALSLANVCILGIQLCSVLGYLHAQQPAIIHRDLKPSNIIVRPGGWVALIDFGIARLSGPAAHTSANEGIERETFLAPRTADTFQNLGSIGYAAPEQYGVKGWTLPCSDLYSLGVIMHQALSGLDPFEKPRESLFDFSPLGKHIPLALRTLVNGLVQRDAGARPQQARTVRFTLTSILEDLRGVSTPPRAGNFNGALVLPDYFRIDPERVGV